jgi:4-amino-4-deoxy-L-arabinose transferase-like glycosyltransferase
LSNIQIPNTGQFFKTRNYLSSWLGIACLVVLFIVFVFAQARNLGGPLDSADEGAKLMTAKLIALGHKPYTQVYVIDPPLYPLVTGLAARIGLTINEDLADSPIPLRTISLVAAIVSGAALFHIGKMVYGPLVGGVATFVILFTPLCFRWARRGLPEIAVMALGVVAVWLVLIYWQRRKFGWLFLAGVAFGITVLLKLLFPFLAVLLAILATVGNVEHRLGQEPGRITPAWAWKVVGRPSLALGLGGLFAVALALGLSDLPAMYEQAWAFHVAGRSNSVWSSPLNMLLEDLWWFIRNNPALIPLVLYAAAFARRRSTWIAWLWLGLGLIMLALQVPMRTRYLVILMPPLALLVGLSVSTLVEQIHAPRSWSKLLALVFGLPIVVWYAVGLPAMARENYTETEVNGEYVAAIAELRSLLAHTAPDAGYVISDEPALVFFAGKLVPPRLNELSKKKVDVGFIDMQEVDRVAEAYHMPPVLTSVGGSRLPRVPGFELWIAANYADSSHIRTSEHDWVLFHTPTMDSQCVPDSAATKVSYQRSTWLFRCLHMPAADQLELVSVRLQPDRIHPGESIKLVMNVVIQPGDWERTSLKAFVHLVDDQGTTVAQADHFLFEDTSEHFPAGVLLADSHDLWASPEVRPGIYRLVIGFYQADTLERLRLGSNPTAENDAIVVGTIDIR